jgi:hypothetical protein
LFGTLGLSAEIVFTAILHQYDMLEGVRPFDLKLQGESYVWMFFIYGLAAVLFPPVYLRLKELSWPARLLVYAIGIFAIEFSTGWMLDLSIGKCPWEYTSRWNICGYIRLDYLPVWMLFGFILEKANLLFDKMTDGFHD